MNAQSAPTELMDGRVWEDFCESLKRAGQLVLANAPADAFDRAEGLRYAGRIASYALRNFIEESDPAAPQLAALPKLGGDNPDYLYSRAAISGEFEYRLRGTRGEASFLGFGSYHGDVGTEEGLRVSGYLAGAELETDGEGNFEIGISCREQPGNWLPMLPETSQLMIRQALVDRRRQRPAQFEIERLGERGAPRPLDAETYTRQLQQAGSYVEGAIAQFLAWSRNFAESPNQVLPLDPTLAGNAQGDPNTHYYGGYYEIGADEALLIDLQPPACEYWNLQLCNHWLESLDYEHHVVHVNHHGAVPDATGRVRVVVAHREPALPNWLDTAGHQRGGMFLRWVGTPDPYDPQCRVVPYREVAGASA